MKEKEIEYVDLRFTDHRGKLQHVTMDTTVVDEDMLENGVFFDGSSIAGWKAINESDMILKPDLSRTVVDPFTSHNTLNIFCDILDAVKKDPQLVEAFLTKIYANAVFEPNETSGQQHHFRLSDGVVGGVCAKQHRRKACMYGLYV